MALTKEILMANAVLSNLTDEQVAAITTISANDENGVIAKKTSEIYSALDADILNASGVAKTTSEKTYDYAKRVLLGFKDKTAGVAGLEAKISELTRENARLQKSINDGTADAETAKQLKQAKADLASVTKQFNDLNTTLTKEREDHARELFDVQIDNEMQHAVSGIKFKAGLPEAATRVLMSQAIAKVKAMNPEYIDEQGNRVLVFKGATGEIRRNPSNEMKPFTAGEILMEQLEGMDVLDKGRRQPGGGTGAPGDTGGNGGSGGSLDLSGIRSRVEATDAIHKFLVGQGITPDKKEYTEKMTQAWKDNDVMTLPEK